VPVGALIPHHSASDPSSNNWARCHSAIRSTIAEHAEIATDFDGFSQGTNVIGARLIRQWRDFQMARRAARPNIAGIYAQARGGTNFIAAALHYHPRIFAVNEHQFDYRRRLSAVFDKGSVFRVEGRQDKRIDQTQIVLFNKMQEFDPVLWDPHSEFPAGSRFIVYLRNPVRVHFSRESYRQRHKPRRVEWVDSRENFLRLLSETQEILETHALLKARYSSLLMTHEYFCCQHEQALPQVHQFLGLQPMPPANPRDFLKHCGKCGRDYAVIEQDKQQWLACPRHGRPVMGCGRFNPLRPLDRDGILDASWKESPDVHAMMSEVRRVLGDSLADYFWNADYSVNLPDVKRHAAKRVA
jgi:hypothetical protein